MKVFLDTNVLVYWVDNGERADQVEQLLGGNCVISVQVLNEFANVLKRKRAMPLVDIQSLSELLIRTCEVHDLSVRTHEMALRLVERYNLSIYDANIVAAARLSGCAVLYSEDMQDGLNIQLPDTRGNTSLSIKNPFHH